MICDHRHPEYAEYIDEWCKWRLTYKGGREFVEKYLEKFSAREDEGDFAIRKRLTPCTAFAKSAVNDIKNSIFQRFVDISRKNGSETYQQAVFGENHGVDLLGSSMNSFIGRKILPELITMKRVGVFVDMPTLQGDTLADQQGKRPYLYYYCAEDICCWDYDEGPNANEFVSILLRDHYYEYDEVYGLPIHCVDRYRYIYKADGIIYIKFFNDSGEQTDMNGAVSSNTYTIELPVIPFVVFSISESLLKDAADYQIALMNMNSSDINYGIRGNFPFYTEQFDSRADSPYLKQQGETGPATEKEAKVGVTQGRRYPMGADRPGFINPSAEPLKASMDKQEQMKQDIRQLINLAVTNLQPTSAESKQMDERSLESGLSCIGLELENGERQIARIWALYEGSNPATISYPTNYTLESTELRIARAEKLEDLMLKIPSMTYQKSVAKEIAQITVGTKVSNEDMAKINMEINAAPNMTSDPDTIASDIENGLLSLELGSKLRGYPPGEVEKAKKDHEERIKRIALAQAESAGAARGVPDLATKPGANGSAEKKESRDSTQDDRVTDKTRGEGV